LCIIFFLSSWDVFVWYSFPFSSWIIVCVNPDALLLFEIHCLLDYVLF